MHPCLGKWVVNGRVVMYYVRAAHAVSAGIECWRCRFSIYLDIGENYRRELLQENIRIEADNNTISLRIC